MKAQRKIFCFLLVFSLLFLISGCKRYTPSPYNDHNNNYHSKDVDENGDRITSENSQPTTQNADASHQFKNPDLEVVFLDVGNADCTFIRLPNGETMLIDGGNVDDGEDILSFLKHNNVSKIDYLVGTHPHEDHIGGLTCIVENMEIGNIYMPKVANKYVPSTIAYNNLLQAMKEKRYKAISPETGDVIFSDESKKIEIKFLNSANKVTSEDLNAYSLVLKLDYNTVSFIFTGDALIECEKNIMNTFSREELKCDILKIAHHGSTTSNSEDWIRTLSPKIAFIPCGKNNEYGHPHDKIIDMLNHRHITIYRADENGSVRVISDGLSWEIEDKVTGDIPLGESGWSASLIK